MSNHYHYAKDGHPTSVRRDAGYAHVSGIVVCGECAVEQTREFVTGGSWDANRSASILTAAGYERLDPDEHDDWCSRCDRDLARD
jgi:hypothetical protein